MMKQSRTEWREIPGCTKYVISEFGSVRHIKTNTTRIPKKGRYIRVYMDNGRAVSSNKVFNLVFPEKDMPTWKTEEWKSIPGFPRYLMHPKGKVWDRNSKKVLVSFLKYKQKHFNLFDGKNWLQKNAARLFNATFYSFDGVPLVGFEDRYLINENGEIYDKLKYKMATSRNLTGKNSYSENYVEVDLFVRAENGRMKKINRSVSKLVSITFR